LSVLYESILAIYMARTKEKSTEKRALRELKERAFLAENFILLIKNKMVHNYIYTCSYGVPLKDNKYRFGTNPCLWIEVDYDK